tara:strand:- start:2687 stop:2887 length:201 start_codon:yes stop_codon:yes gene_type:complete
MKKGDLVVGVRLFHFGPSFSTGVILKEVDDYDYGEINNRLYEVVWSDGKKSNMWDYKLELVEDDSR